MAYKYGYAEINTFSLAVGKTTATLEGLRGNALATLAKVQDAWGGSSSGAYVAEQTNLNGIFTRQIEGVQTYGVKIKTAATTMLHQDQGIGKTFVV
ncbi:WXG100 family type VII secretion target [Tsukamurella hominis]|uniref:WXG100 family type VII secretion target n=1 Tax=Tsukamurella hominis TaxID=1970232 RepID=UPI0039E8EE45